MLELRPFLFFMTTLIAPDASNPASLYGFSWSFEIRASVGFPSVVAT
jgi:hypothetical protein